MTILYKDDQGRIIDINFSTHVRRVEYIDKNGVKYTGYIDSYKPGWTENNEPMLGPGTGILNYEEQEDGSLHLHSNVYLSNDSKAITIDIIQIYSSIDENGELHDLLSTLLCSNSTLYEEPCIIPDRLDYDYTSLDDNSKITQVTLHHNDNEFILSILP